MAIILKSNEDSNVVRILGRLDRDATGEVLLDLTSDYDGETHAILGTGVNSGAWVDITIPGTSVPFSGLYSSTINAVETIPLTLSTTFTSLIDLATALSSFIGPGNRKQLIESLLVQVVGDDEQVVISNTVGIDTTEYGISVTDIENSISSQEIEYNAEAGEEITYNGLDDSRLTYHR